MRRTRGDFGAWRRRAGGAALACIVRMVAAGAAEDAKPPAEAAAPAPPAYWQAPALPSAVIQGGGIPPGWQPQAVPYQGVGPDGQPVTMYFAPTYVFTYPSGPRVPAMPQVNRRRWWGGQPAAPTASPVPSGWNYATSGAAPVTTTLPPGGFTQVQSAYRFPPDARALQGTQLVPPGPLPAAAAPAPAVWGGPAPGGPTVVPPSSPPPSQWVPSGPQPTNTWVPSAPQGSGPPAAVPTP